MDTHVRNLGVIAIVFGLVSTVASLALLLWAGGTTGLFNRFEDMFGMGFVAVVVWR